jgi:Sugar kinases, ribokinase family
LKKVDSVPGGKGGNTSVAAARILGKGEVAIIGMLGPDEIAETQITILKQEGIDVSCISRHGEMSSGQAYVIVDNKGENMILTHHAANKGLTPQSMLSEEITCAIEKSNMVIIIDPPLDAAFELATQAATRRKTVVLSPATLVSNGFSGLERLLRSADYILVNEHEARILASQTMEWLRARCYHLNLAASPS